METIKKTKELIVKDGDFTLSFKIKNDEVVYQSGMFNRRKYMPVNEFTEIAECARVYRNCNGVFIQAINTRCVDDEIYPA